MLSRFLSQCVTHTLTGCITVLVQYSLSWQVLLQFLFQHTVQHSHRSGFILFFWCASSYASLHMFLCKQYVAEVGVLSSWVLQSCTTAELTSWRVLATSKLNHVMYHVSLDSASLSVASLWSDKRFLYEQGSMATSLVKQPYKCTLWPKLIFSFTWEIGSPLYSSPVWHCWSVFHLYCVFHQSPSLSSLPTAR